MSNSVLLRVGAVCGVVLGLSLGLPGAVEAFTGETAVTSLIIGLGAAFGAPALCAIYLSQASVAGRFGAVTFVLNLIGLGLFTGVAFALNLVIFFQDGVAVAEPTKLAFRISALVFVIGTVLFGVSLIRSRVLPRIPSWTYPIALSLLALLAPLPDNVFTSAVHVVAAASLIWLSVAAWSGERVARARS